MSDVSRDFSRKFIFENRPIRGHFVRLTETYQKILSQRAYPSNVAKFLGEALVSTALINGLFKEPGKTLLQFQGTGALQLLSVHGDLNHMRAVAQYSPELSKEGNFLEVLKAGTLALIHQPETSVKSYQSVIEVISPEIAKNLEHYFWQSEQTQTRLWIAVTPVSVTGLLLQLLPDTEESQEESWSHVLALTNTVFEQELAQQTLETLVSHLYVGESIRLWDQREIHFHCPCNKARMENALLLMGQAELEKILNQEEALEVRCEFCGKTHSFDAVDVSGVFRGMTGS